MNGKMNKIRTYLENIQLLARLGKVFGIVTVPFESNQISSKLRNLLYFLPVTLISLLFIYKSITEIFTSYMFIEETRRCVACAIVFSTTVNIFTRIICNFKNRHSITNFLKEINESNSTVRKGIKIYKILIAVAVSHICLISFEFTRGYSTGKRTPSKYYSYLISHISFFLGFFDIFFIQNIMLEICEQIIWINRNINVNGNKEIDSNRNLSIISDSINQSYTLICAAKSVNDIFSLNILVNLGTNFIVIITSTFFLVSNIKRIFKQHKVIISGVLLYATWDAVLLINIFFTINVFTTMTKQVS